jgi:phytoene synthase
MTSAARGNEWGFPNAATPLGSPVYYAIRFSPGELQATYAGLFAWKALIVDIARHHQDPGVARLKLDWWRDELVALADGRPRHPLACALQAAALNEAAVAPMHALIDAVDRSLVDDGPTDDAAFAQACAGEGGSLFLALAAATPGDTHDPRRCREFGGYCDAIERLRLAATETRRIPRDLPQMIGDNDRVAELGRRLEALSRYPGTPSAAGAEAIPAVCRRLVATSRGLHRKLIRQGYPLAGAPPDRAPIAHLWTAWRCR